MRTPWTVSATRCKNLGDTLRSSKAITAHRSFLYRRCGTRDTLVVHILDLQVDGKQGVGTFSPGFGAINATHYTPMLEKEALPEKIWFYPIDHADHTATFQALDPTTKSKSAYPFLGCIGCAPANGEARSSIGPRNSAQHGRSGSLRSNTLYCRTWPGLVLLWRWPRLHGRRRNAGSA